MRITMTASSRELGIPQDHPLGTHYFRLRAWRYQPTPEHPAYDGGAMLSVTPQSVDTSIHIEDMELDSQEGLHSLINALYDLDGDAMIRMLMPLLNTTKGPVGSSQEEPIGSSQEEEELIQELMDEIMDEMSDEAPQHDPAPTADPIPIADPVPVVEATPSAPEPAAPAQPPTAYEEAKRKTRATRKATSKAVKSKGSKSGAASGRGRGRPPKVQEPAKPKRAYRRKGSNPPNPPTE